MKGSNPVRCQKCGKPVGYITVLAKGLMGMQQPIRNVKVVAVCMDCSQKQESAVISILNVHSTNRCLDILDLFWSVEKTLLKNEKVATQF